MKMKGFTLLEMIITLAIMGVAMLSVIKYKEKEANEARRQIVSNALVTEISGMLKFVTEERIMVVQDGEEVEIINPLYSGESKKPYTSRVANKDLNEDMSSKSDEIIDWREARKYFIRKTCKNTGGQSEYEFTTDYIPCNEPSVLNNSDLRIERIDFVGKDDSVGSAIERVDFVLYFDKTSDSETFHFTNYIKNLEKAAEDHSIIFKDMHIVERSSQSVSGWSLTKVDNEPLILGKLPENLGKLVKTKTYGLRISIDPNSGVFLRADGRVGADKLCWNIDSKMAGPCLTADDTGNNIVLTSGLKAEKKEPGICWDMENGTSKLCLTQVAGKGSNDEDKSLLKLKDNEGNPATLLANVIVEESSMEENNNKKIYRTIPNTIYRAFGNSDDGDIVINTPGDYVSDVTSERGRIELNVQECPVAPDGQKLYPRLSASIASIVADTKNEAGRFTADFRNPASNRTGGQLGQLSGTAIQVNKAGDKWYITATMGAFNPADNTTAVYLNPKFLAVNITTWCSSEEQN
ncbi:prepilin-type N-terminal cleavage/methylation domain-containing protein [Escherichia coli]|uniref:prepilin-type N-terminal cleavage/methylation domain-containing protein n=1 Tax=Escherichia coli TaxID=562 RepID=UPI001C484D70|nr:prepilin-type N-terminal cleavage/methylation domain-containing protein [Escherichia coli]MCE0533536.1 prepilin-type N-terminal cleavage/methylation domain-containing protein [Escherichia coli]MCE0552710.1 prepilin-type N-terminal cleavage/methylation domain-containing protein [Escherichia coli]QXN18658.1 prepilin-type N-terminal cleavage/methylation domain-containing protein [Escherichia coli]